MEHPSCCTLLAHHLPLRWQGAGPPKGGLCFLTVDGRRRPRTSIYIDGFNLYYRCLRRTPYEWLNLAKLCESLLPRNDIRQIRYFAALIDARPDDPDQPQRQLTYLRALRTIPHLTIHYRAVSDAFASGAGSLVCRPFPSP